MSCVNLLSRLHDDTCEVDDRLRRSKGPGEYMLQSRASSFEAASCTMRDSVVFASGFNVSVESQLRNGQILTKDGTKEPSHMLNIIPGTVHGCNERSASCTRIESDLTQNRPCGTLVERDDWFERHIMPPASCAHDKMQNPVHVVQEAVSKDWVRGGVHSRMHED